MSKKLGRKSRNQITTFWYSLRTYVWYQFLCTKFQDAELRDINKNIANVLLYRPDHIYRYAKGQGSPSASKINLAANKFPDSRAIYEIGPENVQLWSALNPVISTSDLLTLEGSLISNILWDEEVLVVVKENSMKTKYQLRTLCSSSPCYDTKILLTSTNPWDISLLLNKSLPQLTDWESLILAIINFRLGFIQESISGRYMTTDDLFNKKEGRDVLDPFDSWLIVEKCLWDMKHFLERYGLRISDIAWLIYNQTGNSEVTDKNFCEREKHLFWDNYEKLLLDKYL